MEVTGTAQEPRRGPRFALIEVKVDGCKAEL